jgi:hypothetical protein
MVEATQTVCHGWELKARVLVSFCWQLQCPIWHAAEQLQPDEQNSSIALSHCDGGWHKHCTATATSRNNGVNFIINGHNHNMY